MDPSVFIDAENDVLTYKAEVWEQNDEKETKLQEMMDAKNWKDMK